MLNFFSPTYEADFIHGLLQKNEKKLAQSFNFMFRYIDDVVDRIYPIELEIKYTTDTDRSGSYIGTGTANPSGAPEFTPGC